MIAHSRIVRLQSVLLLAAVGLLGAYAVVFLPLARQADALDRPLLIAWTNLVTEVRTNLVVSGLEAEDLRAARTEVESTLARVREAVNAAAERLRLSPELRDKVNAPFQLVEFEKSRLQVISDLRRLAESNQVAVVDAVWNGFPEYTFAEANPSLLWAELAFANQLLARAVALRPTAIASLAVLPRRSHRADGPALEEVRLRVELHGPVDALTAFLAALPLRAEELQALGHSAGPATEPLFLDRFLLKNSTNGLNHAWLDVVASGFVNLETKP
jgi:hypothetical protein